jgi:hypothetical protein
MKKCVVDFQTGCGTFDDEPKNVITDRAIALVKKYVALDGQIPSHEL